MGRKHKVEPKLESEPTGPMEQHYADKIKPLVDQVLALCKERGIDYIVNFALDDMGDQYLVTGHVRIERDGLAPMVIAAAILSGEADFDLGGTERQNDALDSMPLPGKEPEKDYIQ